MPTIEDLRLAVLIDADNAPHRRLPGIMEEIAVHGTPTIKRIYGDWTMPELKGWKKLLLEYAITPIQQYSYTTGKNSTDSAMIIDAMDILYTGRVDGFCLVSSDSDFTRLATRLREAGMKVIGLGAKKTPRPFIVACDKFIYTEIVGDSPPEPEKKSTAKKKPVGNGSVGKVKAEPEPEVETKAPKAPHIPPEIVTMITGAIDDVSDEDGWAYLGAVGSLITKKKPDFDARNYGYKKLTALIAAVDVIEIDYRDNLQADNGKLIYIRVKQPESKKAGSET